MQKLDGPKRVGQSSPLTPDDGKDAHMVDGKDAHTMEKTMEYLGQI